MYLSQQNHALHMRCSREHIYRCNFDWFISQFIENTYIPCHCCTVAGYIYNSFGCHTYNCFYEIFITALSWRVQYNYIRSYSIFSSFTAAFAASEQINSALLIPFSTAFFSAFSIACGIISTPISLFTFFAIERPIVPVPQ